MTVKTEFLQSINPATLQLLGQVPVASEQEVKGKVDLARQTFNRNKLSLPQRLQLVERFRQILFSRRSEVARLISREAGKPLVESLIAEVFSVLETCAWLQKNAARVLARESVKVNRLFFPFKKSYNVFDPLGVIAVISPWNFPFSIPAGSILEALTAGNTVVLKPSPKTPLTANLLQSMLLEAGFPAGSIMVVHGDRDQARWLVESPVDRIVFTGSVSGGKAIAAMAAEHLKPVTLELGGKHPAIVLPDAKVDRIVDALTWCAFMNAGQACASIERLYVHHSLHDQLTEKLARRANRLRLGDPVHLDTDIGPLIDAAQLARVQAMVERAVSQGGRIAAGGRARAEIGGRLPGGCPGYFMEPSVLCGLWHGQEIVQEEIFGPVLPVVAFHSVEEAVALANASNLALGASVWTSDHSAGEKIARRIRAGMVWINDGLYSHACPDAPWGGLRHSGFGRTHGKHSLLEFVNLKHIGVERQGKRDWNYPYSCDRYAMVDGGIEALHGAGIGSRLLSLLSLVPRLWRVKRSDWSDRC